MTRQFIIASESGGDDIVSPMGPPNEPDIMAAVRRRWRLIAGMAVVGSIAAYVLCHMLTPLYSSTAVVLIDPHEPKYLAASTDSAQPPSEEVVRKNEIAVIRSRSLAEKVVTRLGLDHSPEFDPGVADRSWLKEALGRAKSLAARAAAAAGIAHDAGIAQAAGTAMVRGPNLDQTVNLFLDRLSATSTDASRIVEIRFTSREPREAARIANAVAEQYIQQRVARNAAEAHATVNTLQGEVNGLNLKIRAAEHAIEKMRAERGILPAADVKVLAEQLSDLNRELATAKAQRVTAQGRLAALENARAGRSAAPVSTSPLIERLEEKETEIRARLSEMSTVYGPNHPKIVRARAELRDVHGKLTQEIDKVLAAYHSDAAAARAKEAALRDMVGQIKEEMAKAGASEIDVRALEREADGSRALLTQLVERINGTRAEIDRGADARVISAAVVPRGPSFPPKLAITAVAFLFLVTAGVILAVVLERADGSIRSAAQLRQVSPARLLGLVSRLNGRSRRSPAARVIADRRSLYAENLRGVYFQIECAAHRKARTLLITSAMPREGKSSIAASLSRLLAVAGRKVAIVDGDLRHPTVHRALGCARSPGLCDYVEGRVLLGDVVQIDRRSGTAVIAAGAAAGSPADVLQSPRMAVLIEELAARFDTVIIDTPPMLAVHDAAILARHADMTMMVVRWGTTRVASFVAAAQRLQDLGVSVGGVILSMVDRRRYAQYGSLDGEIFSRAMKRYYSN